jgi:hypothetical protein
MKPQATNAKKEKLSEPAIGVLVAIGAFLLWFLFHTFGPWLSGVVPLKITLSSSGSLIADVDVSFYYVGDSDLKLAKTDANGECSIVWNRNRDDDLVSVKATKNGDVLFDGMVEVPWNRKLRIAVDRDPAQRALLD